MKEYPTFDEFMKKKQTTADGLDAGELEEFTLEMCPTPGCKCGRLTPRYEDGLIVGFSCQLGCEFSAKRNVFTGDVVYYKLEKFLEPRFEDPESVRDMKFNPVGEIYTDWY